MSTFDGNVLGEVNGTTPLAAEGLLPLEDPIALGDESSDSHGNFMAGMCARLAYGLALASTMFAATARPVEAEVLPVAAAETPSQISAITARPVLMARAVAKLQPFAEAEILPVTAAPTVLGDEYDTPTPMVAAPAWTLPTGVEPEVPYNPPEIFTAGTSLARRVAMARAVARSLPPVEPEVLPVAAAPFALDDVAPRTTVVAWDEWTVSLLSDAEDLPTRVDELDGRAALPIAPAWRVAVAAEPEVLPAAPPTVVDEFVAAPRPLPAASWLVPLAVEPEALPTAAAPVVVDEFAATPVLLAATPWRVPTATEPEALPGRIVEDESGRVLSLPLTWASAVPVAPEVLPVALPIALEELDGRAAAVPAVTWSRAAAAVELEVLPGPRVPLHGLSFTRLLFPRISIPDVSARPRYSVQGLTLSPRFTFMIISPDFLALGVDTVLQLKGVKVFSELNGQRVPLTGATLLARVSLTPTGAAINAGLEITLTERVAGEFHGTFQGDALETHLRAQLGSLVYVALRSGADFVGHFPVRVIDGVPVRG